MTDHQITEAMITYGGTFVNRLGQLYRLADAHNQAKLKAAFPGYWTEFTRIAEMQAKQGQTHA